MSRNTTTTVTLSGLTYIVLLLMISDIFARGRIGVWLLPWGA